MKIAVIDDNEAMGKSICRMLAIDNYSADYFNNGISLLKEDVEQYDVLLIDYYLPDTLGVSLIKEIKRMNIDSTIITMSVESDEQTDTAARMAGVHFMLQKPFRYEELRTQLKHTELNMKIIKEFSAGGRSSKHMLLVTNGTNIKIDLEKSSHIKEAEDPFTLEGKDGVFFMEIVNTEILYDFLTYFLDKKLFLLNSKYIIKVKPMLYTIERETEEKLKIRNILKTHAFIIDV